MRADVCRLGKITRAGVLRRVEIANVHPDPVRHAIVGVATVVVCARREISCERIDPCARSNLVLVAIQAGDVRVGAARAKMRACLAIAGVTRAANTFFQRFKGMFPPRLANLFEAIVVKCAAAHPVEILRNVWVIGIWQRKPVDRLVAIVTGVCSYRQANLCLGGGSHFLHVFDLSDNDIGPWHRRVHSSCAMQGRHDHRFGLAVNKLLYLDRLHHCAERDSPYDRIGI